MSKIYYHVVTERPMELNQGIIFDDNHHSGVFERIYKEKDLVDKVYSNNEVELTDNLKKALREFALEDVRENEFSNYPSRLSCLYVSKSLKEAEFWYNLFIDLGRPTFQIVKVEVDGREFTGDAWNVFEGTTDIDNNKELAKRYWLNLDNNQGKEPILETIVDGKIKVIEIVKIHEVDYEK